MYRTPPPRPVADGGAVHKPGPRLLAHLPLSYFKRRTKSDLRRQRYALLGSAVSSALLAVFATALTGFVELPPNDMCGCSISGFVRLARAENGVPVGDAPTVVIFNHRVFLDQVLVGELGRMDLDEEALRIEELGERLGAMRKLWNSIQPRRAFPGEVLLAVDVDTPWVEVKSIARTALEEGFPHLSFLVVSRSFSKPPRREGSP